MREVKPRIVFAHAVFLPMCCSVCGYSSVNLADSVGVSRDELLDTLWRPIPATSFGSILFASGACTKIPPERVDFIGRMFCFSCPIPKYNICYVTEVRFLAFQ